LLNDSGPIPHNFARQTAGSSGYVLGEVKRDRRPWAMIAGSYD